MGYKDQYYHGFGLLNNSSQYVVASGQHEKPHNPCTSQKWQMSFTPKNANSYASQNNIRVLCIIHT